MDATGMMARDWNRPAACRLVGNMRVLIIIGMLVGLAGCNGLVEREAYLNRLVGAPEVDVVRILGVPSRTYGAGRHKYLAYIERRAEIYSGGPFFFGGGFYGPGYGGLAAFPAEIIDRTCETTFDVVAGRVAAWTLRGNACGYAR